MPRSRPWNAPVFPSELGTYWEPKAFFPELDQNDYYLLSRVPDLPPLEHDHPFDGRLRVVELGSKEEVWRVCENAWRGHGKLANSPILGCTIRRIINNFDPNADCVVFLASRDELLRFGLTYNVMMRHEISHCNGWSGDHEGRRGISSEAQEEQVWKEKDRKAEEAWKEWQKTFEPPDPNEVPIPMTIVKSTKMGTGG